MESAAEMDDDDTNIKIITLGQSGVGKTCLINRFTSGEFKEKNEPTIDMGIISRDVSVNDMKLKVTIYDTVGQERFHALTESYYRNADGVLLVCDVSEDETYTELISKWLPMAQKRCKEDVVVLIVGNKIDSPKVINVVVSSLKHRAESEDLEFTTASAKEEINVDEVFYRLIKKIAEKRGFVETGTDPTVEKIAGLSSSSTVKTKPTLQTQSKLPKYTGNIILFSPKSAIQGRASSSNEMSTQTDVETKSYCCTIF